MSKDPIVEEVRQVRRQIEAEHGRDPQAYYEHLLRLQENWKERLVRRRPVPALKAS
jgi:hypothetical protein